MQQELRDSAWNHNGEKPEGRPIIARRFIAGGWGNVISSVGKSLATVGVRFRPAYGTHITRGGNRH
jgi:hypothetical protein